MRAGSTTAAVGRQTAAGADDLDANSKNAVTPGRASNLESDNIADTRNTALDFSGVEEVVALLALPAVALCRRGAVWSNEPVLGVRHEHNDALLAGHRLVDIAVNYFAFHGGCLLARLGRITHVAPTTATFSARAAPRGSGRVGWGMLRALVFGIEGRDVLDGILLAHAGTAAAHVSPDVLHEVDGIHKAVVG